MEIHKPKPWHGAKEFLKEYLIIVVGVLTALGAEQAVEWIHHSRELDEFRETVRKEVQGNADAAAFTIAEDRCLMAIADRVAAWAKGGPRPETPAMVNPFFTTTIWDTSQASSRMPIKEKTAYVRVAETARNVQTIVVMQRNQSMIMSRYMAHETLDTAEARALVGEAFAAAAITNAKIGNAQTLLAEAKGLGITPRPEPTNYIAMLKAECQIAGMPTPPVPGL